MGCVKLVAALSQADHGTQWGQAGALGPSSTTYGCLGNHNQALKWYEFLPTLFFFFIYSGRTSFLSGKLQIFLLLQSEV